VSTRVQNERGVGVVPLVGLLVTIGVHAGVLGAAWLMHHAGGDDKKPQLGAYVDAQLVKFGKPRDMSFLPHKEGSVKNTVQKADIKIAKDANAPITPKEEKAEVDPLKKTRAELFKQLKDDDRPPAVEETGGSLQGSRAGTASEAKGDPYILSLIDKIGSAWTIPTTIKDSDLKDLSADVCLTIDGSGALTHFDFIRKSGNSQFDSSLEATLGTLKAVPAPPDRFRSAAARGKLCPTFQKL
jgi:hypothetical protein